MPALKGSSTQRILVIRRDNIGDLVCTTPMIHSLRERFRDAHIAALVNSYNAAVLDGNPDIDQVHVYTKAKHRAERQSLIRVYWDRARLMVGLRQENYDYAILAGSGFQRHALRTARLAGARHIIGFVHQKGYRGPIDLPVWKDPKEIVHEVELVNRLLHCLGIEEPPSKLRVFPDPARVSAARQILHARLGDHVQNLVGLHISARSQDRLWPEEKFLDLVRKLYEQYRCGFALFWSPGPDSNPLHPGDDRKARAIVEGVRMLPIHGFRTDDLNDLIAGLSLCKTVICSDGGAMHLAAALGKKIVCFFGREYPERWRPWGVPHVLLRPPSREVRDITAGEVLEAYASLV